MHRDWTSAIKQRTLIVLATISSSLASVAGTGMCQCPTGVTFAEPRQYPAVQWAFAVDTGDFNGDGYSDLVVGSSQPHGVSIHIGRGDGTFLLPTVTANGIVASYVAVGDYNGDGIQDIAAGNGSNTGAISILLGMGTGGVPNGTFGGPINVPVGQYPSELTAVDLNSDGYDDLVCISSGYFTVLIAAGPSGSPGSIFSSIIWYQAGPTPRGLRLRDLNADGITDAVVADFGNSGVNGGICVMEGLGSGGVGDGTFAAPTVYTILESAAFGPAIADFDGDGILDILSVGTALYLFRGHGTGGIGDGTYEPGLSMNPRVPFWSTTVATDLNGDGAVDIVGHTDGLQVLFGRVRNGVPDGTFGDLVTFGGGFGNGGFAFTDLTGDGRPDAVGAYGFYAGSISILDNTTCVTVMNDAPHIDSITDVPLDQGGRVKVAWSRSGRDTVPDGLVSSYWLWRSVPTSAAAARLAAGKATLLSRELSPLPRDGGRILMRTTAFHQDYYWEYVASQPAAGLAGYSYVAPTTSDSTDGGNPLTAFFVQARSGDGSLQWDSQPDSGYSVDNLPPQRLRNIGGYYAPPSSVTIHWPPGQDEGLSHYVVYSGTSKDFRLDPARRLTETADTVHTSNSFNRTTFFKVTAVDIHGNESEPITLAPGQVTGVDQLDVPTVTYLRQNHPNPFNPETVIEFGIPATGQVTLRVYNASGRAVRTLINEDRPAGVQRVRWNGKDDRGVEVPSGVYVAQLVAQGSRDTIKMVLTR